jgi:hypothetical protein
MRKAVACHAAYTAATYPNLVWEVFGKACNRFIVDAILKAIARVPLYEATNWIFCISVISHVRLFVLPYTNTITSKLDVSTILLKEMPP